eukprot:292153_1
MGNVLSSEEQWNIYWLELGASSLAYSMLYLFLLRMIKRKLMKAKDRLYLTTNIGSTVHSFLMVIFTAFFFIEKRWKKPVVDDPKAAGHVYCWWTSYMFIDLIFHIIFYFK